VQLAVAIEAGAPSFLTNDARLAAVSDLNVVVLDRILASMAPQSPADPNPE
jgi:predicted nucleic acid-binding protein